MQRLIESTLINNLLSKYEERYNECQSKWDNNYKELRYDTDISSDRKTFLLDDMESLNIQISAYECIVKDLKELIK